MFSWFKAKAPKPKVDWEILKNGKGEYFVRRVTEDSYLLNPSVYSAHMYFQKKVFGNQTQAEQAIFNWQADQELKKKTHVKYL